MVSTVQQTHELIAADAAVRRQCMSAEFGRLRGHVWPCHDLWGRATHTTVSSIARNTSASSYAALINLEIAGFGAGGVVDKAFISAIRSRSAAIWLR
jgi:hypothetical protein